VHSKENQSEKVDKSINIDKKLPFQDESNGQAAECFDLFKTLWVLPFSQNK